MNRIHGWTGFHIWFFDLSIPLKVLRNTTVLPPLETPRLGPDEQATTCYDHLRVPKLITSLISGTNHSVSNLWFLNTPKTSINTIDKGNNSWTAGRPSQNINHGCGPVPMSPKIRASARPASTPGMATMDGKDLAIWMGEFYKIFINLHAVNQLRGLVRWLCSLWRLQ